MRSGCSTPGRVGCSLPVCMGVVSNSTSIDGRAGGDLSAADIQPLRIQLGLTRAQLAERAGISASMLRLLEAGAVPERGSALGRVLDELRPFAGMEADTE